MKAATYPRPRLLIEWLCRRRSTRGGRKELRRKRGRSHVPLGVREKRKLWRMRTREQERERERESEGGGSRLPRERARHLISEIPNIFKSTGAAAAAAAAAD